MEYIYCSDVHMRGKNSVYRIGDYYHDCLGKFAETVNLASQTENKILIVGGDLFDSFLVSNSIIDDVLDIIEDAKIKVFIVYGNHDLRTCNVDRASSINHMVRRSNNVSILEELEGDDFIIKSMHYQFGIEEYISREGLKFEETSKLKIAIPHAFITIKPFLPMVAHIQAKEIETNADIVLCSHFHSDWGIKEVNGTRYVNVGCFGRLTINEVKHMPKVVKVNTKDNTIEIIPLQLAKKGENVFDLTLVEQQKEFKNNIDNFIQGLESTKQQGLSIAGMINATAKENDIDQDVVDLIYEKIGEVDND